MRRVVVSHECCMGVCIRSILISNFAFATRILEISFVLCSSSSFFIRSLSIIFSSISALRLMSQVMYVTYVKEIHSKSISTEYLMQRERFFFK